MTQWSPDSRDEITSFRRFLTENSAIFSTKLVVEQYRSSDLKVETDPMAPTIANLASEALLGRRGYSIIRMGDGECNLAMFGLNYQSSRLDNFCVQQLMQIQADSLAHPEKWGHFLQERMSLAVREANVIGVPGIWRPGNADVTSATKSFISYPRGVSGYWRGIRYFVELAQSGALAGKLITSAHLYVGIIAALDMLIEAARKVLCISNRPKVTQRLANRFPNREFRHIDVGGAGECRSPDFLESTKSQIDSESSGILVLIGAGPWAEIYCTDVKRKGGVAIDVGSGFDLLDGKRTRPIHKRFSDLGYLSEQFTFMP